MTNLIPSARRRWITRGRVLVGLPIAFGLFLNLLLFLLVLQPIWQDAQELERRRDSLLQLQRNLPALEQQLEKESVALMQAENQQALLIGLLAGQDKVTTFLALLNQQARISGVTIHRYEPMKTSMSSAESKQKRSSSQSGDHKTDVADPLLALGYQKSSVALAVRGTYAGLQEFLQQMELLELLVESSDLEIKAASTNNDDQGTTSPVASRTELTLLLSFYDPRKDDVDSGNSQEEPPN